MRGFNRRISTPRQRFLRQPSLPCDRNALHCRKANKTKSRRGHNAAPPRLLTEYSREIHEIHESEIVQFSPARIRSFPRAISRAELQDVYKFLSENREMLSRGFSTRSTRQTPFVEDRSTRRSASTLASGSIRSRSDRSRVVSFAASESLTRAFRPFSRDAIINRQTGERTLFT